MTRLSVEVYDILDPDSRDPVGVGCRVLSRKKGRNGSDDQEWWINVHPNEIKELRDMLKEAERCTWERRKELEAEGFITSSA